MLFEETDRTLFCSDLVQQNGDRPPLGGTELLDLSRQSVVAYQQGPFADYMPYTHRTAPIIERLAALQPRTLATMHGSVFRGDGAAVLRELGRTYAEVFGVPER